MLQFRRTIILLRHSSGKKEEKETGSSPLRSFQFVRFLPPFSSPRPFLNFAPSPLHPSRGLHFPSLSLIRSPAKKWEVRAWKKDFLISSLPPSLPALIFLYSLQLLHLSSSLSLSPHTQKMGCWVGGVAQYTALRKGRAGWKKGCLILHCSVMLLSRIVGGVGERRRGERKML